MPSFLIHPSCTAAPPSANTCYCYCFVSLHRLQKKRKEFYVKKKGLEFRENSMTVHVIGRFAFSSTFRYFSRKLSRIYLKSKDMHFLKNGLNLQSYIPTTSFFVTIATYRNSLKIHFRGN